MPDVHMPPNDATRFRSGLDHDLPGANVLFTLWA
jgi:hypothetical protein